MVNRICLRIIVIFWLTILVNRTDISNNIKINLKFCQTEINSTVAPLQNVCLAACFD